MSLLTRIEKAEKNSTTAKIAMWYTISNVLSKGIAVLTASIFTRLLTKTEYGQFSNFTSWEGILIVLVTLDLTASIARAKYDFDERMDEYMSSILLLSNVVTVVAWLIIELNQSFFTEFFSMDMFYIRVMFVYMFFYPAFSYLQNKHRIYKKYILFAVFSLSTAVIRTIVSVLLVVFFEDRLLGRVCGYVVPITIFNFALWVSIVYKGRKIKREFIRYACLISVPLIPHALSGILLGNSDRVMIMNFCGAEDTAVYSLAYQVSMLANIIWTSMNQAWTPWLYDCIHADQRERINKRSKIYLGTFAVLILGVTLLTPEIILILGGWKYYDARFVMPPVIMGCAFQFVYSMYVNLEIYEKKTATISLGTVAAALLNIGLNWVFIPRYGYIAAAYTTLVGYAALFCFHFLIVKKTIPSMFGLYDVRFIAVILCGIGLMSAAALFLYRLSAVRYGFAAVYCIVLSVGGYRYRNELLKLLGRRGKSRKI